MQHCEKTRQLECGNSTSFENRSLLQGAARPENFVKSAGPNGSISIYRQNLADGRQIWVEVRNGTEITNGGVNLTPR
jgi:hypothetical protein